MPTRLVMRLLRGDEAVSIWDEMARQAADRRRESERRQQERDAVIRELAAQRQMLAIITQRTERAERARELRAQQEAAASRLDADAGEELQQLTGLLSAAAAEPARDLDEFRRAVPAEPAPTIADVAGPPRPQWSQYAPAQPGLFGHRRYDRAVAAARAQLDADLARHDQTLASGLAELTRRHQLCAEEHRRSHEAEWEAITAGTSVGNPDAVDTLAARSLRISTALRGLIEGGRTTYDPAARELVLEIDIPDTDVIPSEQGWKYVVSRTSVVPTPIKPSEAAAIYAGLVAQVILAVLDACFRSCGAKTVDVLSVNGHVQTINPATGRPDHPCLVTVTTDRATFEEIDLLHPKLDPKACLQARRRNLAAPARP